MCQNPNIYPKPLQPEQYIGHWTLFLSGLSWLSSHSCLYIYGQSSAMSMYSQCCMWADNFSGTGGRASLIHRSREGASSALLCTEATSVSHQLPVLGWVFEPLSQTCLHRRLGLLPMKLVVACHPASDLNLEYQ